MLGCALIFAPRPSIRLTLGYAHAARVRGATLVTGTEVLSLLRRGDRVTGVRTLTGDLES